MHIHRKLVTAFVIAIPAVANAALYEEVTQTHLPPGLSGACMNAAAGDADGDGDLDLALAMEFEPKILLLNDGSGRFSDASMQLPRTVHDSEDVAFADFDGDGDLDLVFVSEDDRTDELFINDGTGRFSDASERLVTDDVRESAQDYLLLNDGTGHFTRAHANAFPEDARSNFTLKTLDIDRDGDIDAIAPSTVFADFAAEFASLVRDAGGQRHVLLGDVLFDDYNGDGIPDARISDGTRDVVLLNDGKGLTYPAGEEPWTRVATVGNYDVDGNGEFDLVYSEISSSLFSTPVPGGQGGSMQIFDLGRDGIIDIVAQVRRTTPEVGSYQVLLNDGRGQFSVAEPGSVLPESADGNGFDVEVADYDGNGLLDLFLCNRTSIAQSADQARAGGLQRLLFGIDE